MTGPDSDPYTSDERRVLVALGRLQPEDRAFDRPPSSVWTGIVSAVGRDEPTGSVPAAPARHPRRRVGVLAAAAAVVAALVVGVASLRTDRSAGPELVAAVELSSDRLPGAPAGLRGRAEVLERGGDATIHLDVGSLAPPADGYLEVWLIAPEVSGMVSLGSVRADGLYAIPAGLRIADYPIVDVSAEPLDGDPSHSGASLLRGVLEV